MLVLLVLIILDNIQPVFSGYMHDRDAKQCHSLGLYNEHSVIDVKLSCAKLDVTATAVACMCMSLVLASVTYFCYHHTVMPGL